MTLPLSPEASLNNERATPSRSSAQWAPARSAEISAYRDQANNSRARPGGGVSSPASTLIDATRRRLPDMVRASLHYYNDETEIDRMMDVLEPLTRR